MKVRELQRLLARLPEEHDIIIFDRQNVGQLNPAYEPKIIPLATNSLQNFRIGTCHVLIPHFDRELEPQKLLPAPPDPWPEPPYSVDDVRGIVLRYREDAGTELAKEIIYTLHLRHRLPHADPKLANLLSRPDLWPELVREVLSRYEP